MRPVVRPLFLFALLLGLSALVLRSAPAAAFHEYYGRILYPALSGSMAFLTGWTAFPLGLVLLPIAVIAALWRVLAPTPRRPAWERISAAMLLVVALWAGYFLVWGANYRRPSLPNLLDLAQTVPTASDLEGLAEEMLVWVAMTSATERDVAGAVRAIAMELEGLADEVGWPAHVPRRAKALPPGMLLRSGFAGMLFPYTLEAQVDSGLASHSRVWVGAHELAHSAGFSGEADADLAALIASLRSQSDFARYAAALSLLARTLGALPPDVQTRIRERLPERARQDLNDAGLRSARYLRPSLAAQVTFLYHRLLRSQGVTDGVAEYGRGPQLAVSAYRRGLLPRAE